MTTAARPKPPAKPAKKTTTGTKKATKRTRPTQRRRTALNRQSMSTAMHGMSLRTRVSLLVMVTVGLTLAIGSIVSNIIVRNEIISRLDEDLHQRADLAYSLNLTNRQALEDPQTSATLTELGIKEALVEALPGGGYHTTTPPVANGILNNQPVSFDAAAPVGQPEVDVAFGNSNENARTVVTSDGTYRVLAVRIAPGEALVIATSIASTEATLHTLDLTSILVGLAGIAIAGTAGFFLGRAALRPVERLTVATEYIARTGDLRRIEVTGDDELARLTTSFNTMLAALARSQDYQRRLVADAGHELRTPLTSMRTNLDLLAQVMAEPENQRLSAEDRVDLMSDVRAQMEELSLLISDLVELSRDEHPAHAVEQIDFSEIVERAVQRVQRRAPSLTYDVQLTPWYLQGEPTALERAVTNLLDNAAKWSPPEGTVTVSLHEGALQVADQGPGIADEDLPHIFERFYRSPEARTMPGSGLGLAIVRQVAENHGGRVAAARAPGGGALLGVWLPGVSEPTADQGAPAGAAGTAAPRQTTAPTNAPGGSNGSAPATEAP